jgi:hypothetical protein
MSDMQHQERLNSKYQPQQLKNPTTAYALRPGEERARAPRATSFADDPELAGNPIARAHARASRSGNASTASGGHPVKPALVFLVVLPTILFLVTNPVGWIVLFMLCLGFGYLFGFGAIL